MDHVALSYTDVAATVAGLAGSGARVLEPVHQIPGLYRAAMIEDPWGVKLELVEDPQLLGFHHAHTRAADPAAMLRWFEDVFGGRRGMLKGRIEGLQFGPVWLLVDRADNPPPSDGHAIDHLGFRTTDITGAIELPSGTEMVMPGDNTEMTVELIAPIAMEEGLRFAIREGGRTVGAGRVTKILK